MQRLGQAEGDEEDRGQSSVLGVVLILGLVIASMTVIATVGGVALLDTSDELSVSRAQKVMTQFDSQSALVALGETNARQTELVANGDGQYALDEDAGWMKIEVTNTTANTTQTIANRSLGAVVYETGGVQLAYQGGGVWQKGDGEATMVSPPEFHYRGRTLTLPIINVTGDSAVGGDVTIRQAGITKEYPDRVENESFVNPVPTSREVVVTVRSEYYRGWGAYFERRTEGDVSYDDANRTASITLTVPITENFDNAVTATSSTVDGGMVNGQFETGVSRPSADGLVTDEIDICESGSGGCTNTTSLSGTVTSGTYYSSSDMSIDGATFDTDGGDINVVVNGTVTLDGNIDIDDGGNVTVYAKGMATGSGSPSINTDGDVNDLLIYLHSDATAITLNGNPQYTGLIYAPSTDLNINGGGGNTNIVGSVVLEKATRSGNSQAAVVNGVSNIQREINFDSGTATITYLHISATKVEISES
jgi:hypothetical protein